VKTETREIEAAPPAPAPVEQRDAEEPHALAAVQELTIASDYSGFFHPKVDEKLRHSALRKLFSDPHFNVMDGLDTYIDDYSKTEPIPAAMLAGLKQAQRIFAWAAETEEEAKLRRSGVPAPESEAAPDVALPATGSSETETDVNAASEPAAVPVPKM